MNCRDNESLILAERDGALTQAQVAALSDHVAECPACRKLRAELAAALDLYKTSFQTVAVPDADEAWRNLQHRLHELPAEPAKKRPLPPVIWFGATLAAAAALTFSFFLSRPPAPAPSEEVAVTPPPPPLYDPSIIAGADFVEAGDPNASTLVYVDKESGWLVVWATGGDATSG
jgi:anti-sigma factor RsiW